MDRKKLDRKGVGAIFIVMILAVVLAGTTFYMVSSAQNAEKERLERIAENQAMAKQFEDLLNGFLKDVADSLTTYKNERKVLVEALRPGNLREPAYVMENYQLVQELTPKLLARMDSTMAMFDAAEAKVNELMADKPEESRQIISAKWAELKATHGKTYSDFFNSERELLKVYGELIGFYYAKRDVFTVDPATLLVVFQDPQDHLAEAEMKQRITDLYAAQNALLTRGAAAPVGEQAPAPVPEAPQ